MALLIERNSLWLPPSFPASATKEKQERKAAVFGRLIRI
jgi:hypothetical protein